MRCPFCGSDDTQVKDSRPTEDNAAIRRRRKDRSGGDAVCELDYCGRPGVRSK